MRGEQLVPVWSPQDGRLRQSHRKSFVDEMCEIGGFIHVIDKHQMRDDPAARHPARGEKTPPVDCQRIRSGTPEVNASLHLTPNPNSAPGT